MAHRFRKIASKCRRFILPPSKVMDQHLQSPDSQIQNFRSWGYYNDKRSGSPRILMAAGHGYGNVGDEAQCGACISRWKQVAPDCKITLFSPNPSYTEALHGEQCEWAPRVAWFKANTSRCYDDSHPEFYRTFRSLRWRILLSAHFLKRGIPLLFCCPREARILSVLQSHDLLHISGGGFLTGKTRSRLWENCLLMRVCQILGIPYILTGHNIGVFQDDRDRKLAYWGLKSAKYIGLRDKGISESELAEIGIKGSHVESSCDDALFCARLDEVTIRKIVLDAGADPDSPWAAVNFHHWGQDAEKIPKIEARFAELCDVIQNRHGLQCLFISMTPSDVTPNRNILNRMNARGFLIPYSPDYRVVRGVIADARLCFTMKHHPIVFAQGEGVPVVSVALDDYYRHKNSGALANTSHERFLIDSNAFYTEEISKRFAEVLENRASIDAELEEWTQKMKISELSVYKQMLKEIK